MGRSGGVASSATNNAGKWGERGRERKSWKSWQCQGAEGPGLMQSAREVGLLHADTPTEEKRWKTEGKRSTVRCTEGVGASSAKAKAVTGGSA